MNPQEQQSNTNYQPAVKKPKVCSVCKTVIPEGANECPQCGNKINRWYKKWWGILLIALFVAGFISTIFNPVKSEQAGSPTQVSGTRDYGNLTVGDTASWNNYSVTLEKIETREDGSVEAKIRIEPKESWTCKAKFFSLGNQVPTMSVVGNDDELYKEINLGAGKATELILRVSGTNSVSTLDFNNWGNEATWSFQPIPVSAKEETSDLSDDKSKNAPATSGQDSAARSAEQRQVTANDISTM